MDTEKRKARVGHGVDEPVRQMAALRAQDVVVAAKRDDPRLDVPAAEPCQAIGVHAGAEDGVARRRRPPPSSRSERRARPLDDAVHLVAKQ